jgi:hypothetical protein
MGVAALESIDPHYGGYVAPSLTFVHLIMSFIGYTNRSQIPVTETEIAFEAAINVLRDSVECQRMPSGLPLQPDAIEIHTRSADILGRLLRQSGGEP